MATEHKVELNYHEDPVTHKRSFGANPKSITINQHDTVSFHKGTAPENGVLQVTFRDPHLFSQAHFHEGDQPVTIVATPVPTTYHCTLMVDGKVFAESSEAEGGGDMVPGSVL